MAKNTKIMLLSLASFIFLCLVILIVADHDKDIKPEKINHSKTSTLKFKLPEEYTGTDLYCVGPNSNWPPDANQAPDFTNNNQGQSVVNLTNQTAGQYWCNANNSVQWLAYNGEVITNMNVNSYTLTASDTEDNGIGGGNWTFILEDDGTVRCTVNCGGVVHPPVTCDPLNPPATIDVPVIFKSYDSLTFTPQVAFEFDNWVPHAMTPVSTNMFTYTYTDVPTNLPYTINFINPTTGEELYNESSPIDSYLIGSYLTIVNGTQVNRIMGNDIWVNLNPCGIPVVNYHDLVFNWTPSNPTQTGRLIFGNNTFKTREMNQVSNDWVQTLKNIAPGRYETNISYLHGSGAVLPPDMAIWPDYIDGTITINDTVMNTSFIIDYGQIVQMPDPTNPNMIYLLQANLIFDLLPDGNVLGVDMGDPIINIIIPIP